MGDPFLAFLLPDMQASVVVMEPANSREVGDLVVMLDLGRCPNIQAKLKNLS